MWINKLPVLYTACTGAWHASKGMRYAWPDGGRGEERARQHPVMNSGIALPVNDVKKILSPAPAAAWAALAYIQCHNTYYVCTLATDCVQ